MTKSQVLELIEDYRESDGFKIDLKTPDAFYAPYNMSVKRKVEYFFRYPFLTIHSPYNKVSFHPSTGSKSTLKRACALETICKYLA
jgi:hypothetical protein